MDKDATIISFEDLIKRKKGNKNISYDETVCDILKTATKARKSVNDILGLEG